MTDPTNPQMTDIVFCSRCGGVITPIERKVKEKENEQNQV